MVFLPGPKNNQWTMIIKDICGHHPYKNTEHIARASATEPCEKFIKEVTNTAFLLFPRHLNEPYRLMYLNLVPS